MKLLVAQSPKRRPDRPFPPGNEVLRLAVEIFDGNGHWPAIDLAGARLRHWNGRQIAVARSDLADLIARGLLDGAGRWSAQGRRELARYATIEASAA